jgi:hypothetical protein
LLVVRAVCDALVCSQWKLNLYLEATLRCPMFPGGAIVGLGGATMLVSGVTMTAARAVVNKQKVSQQLQVQSPPESVRLAHPGWPPFDAEEAAGALHCVLRAREGAMHCLHRCVGPLLILIRLGPLALGAIASLALCAQVRDF